MSEIHKSETFQIDKKNTFNPDNRIETNANQLYCEKYNPDKRVEWFKQTTTVEASNPIGTLSFEKRLRIVDERNKRENTDNKTYTDDNGNSFRVGNELIPNNQYEINGYAYKTDDRGRIISAEGKLYQKEHEGRLTIHDSIENIGKGNQKETDDRGHLIGDQFNGSNGMENMIPQDANINRNDFKNLENELAKEVKAGNEVSVKVEPQYEGDSNRPIAISYTYTINGETNIRIFPND